MLQAQNVLVEMLLDNLDNAENVAENLYSMNVLTA